MTKSLYDVLEVTPAASPEVIQAAYLGLRGKYANRDADSKSLEHLAAIELAYEILSDPAKRNAYGFVSADNALASATAMDTPSVASNFAVGITPTEIATSPPRFPEGTESKILFSGLGILLVCVIAVYLHIESEKEQKHQAEVAQAKAESDMQEEIRKTTRPLDEALNMLSGRSAPQNFAGAFSALKEIVENSTSADIRSRAAIEIGLMHLDGKGLPLNASEAALWFRRAISDVKSRRIPIEQIDNFPAFTLGKMYEAGIGVPKSLDYSYAWFNIAASQQRQLLFFGTPAWDYTRPGWVDRKTEAEIRRNKIAALLSSEQLQRAQALSQDMAFWGLSESK